MGSSSSSSQYTAAATHPSDVRRMSAAQRITTQLSPTHHDSRRQSHPGNATAAYAVPVVMVPVRLPPQPPRQSVPPAIYQFSRQNSWNETRDLTFCRILGAEEFLGRMLEQDDLLRHLSQRDNREELTPQIVETLGLRGHLQCELVRIERMLAENDPELKNIATYEISNAAVVEVLREIRDEAKRLRDSEMQTEVTSEEVNQGNRKSMGTGTTEQGMGGSMTSLGVQTNNDGRFGMYGSVGVNGHASIENGTSVREGGRSPGGDAGLPNGLHGSRGVGVGVDGFNDSDRLRNVATETDLEQLHKQEELELAEKFARRIAGGPRQLSSDEVNEVLGDHAKSVQALKRRHDLDRQKLLRRLEQRKMELEHRNNYSNDDDGNDDDDNDDDKQPGKMRRKKGDERVSRGKELGELVDENTRTMVELKRVKDLEKQRIQEMLKRKQQGLTKVVSEDEEEGKEGSHEQSRANSKDPENEETSSLNRRRAGGASSNDPGLEEVVRTLESMRLSGELSEETMTNILRQYNKSRLNGPSEKEKEEGEKEGEDRSGRKNKRNKKQPKQDEGATRDAVQRLVQDNQLTMEEIQRQRSKEKELIERKLKLKLDSKAS